MKFFVINSRDYEKRCRMERKRNLPVVKLPMGIENFERIRKDGFYYVDKTGLIRDLIQNMSYVNLFTRPRRFGKTLNMSMLKFFLKQVVMLRSLTTATFLMGWRFQRIRSCAKNTWGNFR